jgi:uncharacterized membrane protein YdjX (TVP38/TMEM64 family)
MVFITINFLVFGNVIGFIISWVCTILGCIMSYLIFKNGFGNKFERLTDDKELLRKYKKTFKNINITYLTLLIAIPFTPAFMINIAAGLVKMDFKKYFISLLIGKIGLIYFWGFVGTSFVQSLKEPIVLIKIAIILIITYIISYFVNKLLKLK